MALLVSVNVGIPREVKWLGRSVTTGIFKAPVAGTVGLHRHNLDGDRQADLSVHGGPTKAVYLYPSQHYDYWRSELASRDLPWGSFGENLTVAGLDEEMVCIGDEFRIGSARIVVTEPRMPCFKLAIRFDRPDMVRRFSVSLRSGFYLGIVEEGLIRAGEQVERVAEHPDGLRVADVTRLYVTEKKNEALLRKASSVLALPQRWRDRFGRQLEALRN